MFHQRVLFSRCARCELNFTGGMGDNGVKDSKMSGYGCFISLAGDCPDGEPSGDSVIITDSGFAIGGVSDARERLLSGAASILESVTKISVSKNLISNLSPWLSTIPLVGLSILVSTSAAYETYHTSCWVFSKWILFSSGKFLCE